MARKKPGTLATSRLGRRIGFSTAGWKAGLRAAGDQWSTLRGKEGPAITGGWAESYARYFVEEIGHLKGSVVKVAQMLAIYGEHFLPAEVTDALHTLENRVPALPWSTIQQQLQRQLGAQRLSQLEVEQIPIGAASLSQVHRARHLSDGAEFCLKIQYPGIAQAIDGDLDDIARLLKLSRLIAPGQQFDDWLEQARVMLHREVDYHAEAAMTVRLATLLQDYPAYAVPQVYSDYCTDSVLALSYEAGLYVTSDEVLALPLQRRNKLAINLLQLLLLEVFELGIMQTDPNFGNYLVRLGSAEDGSEDVIVLLDCGSVCELDADFLAAVSAMVEAAYHRDIEGVESGAVALGFIPASMPVPERRVFAEVLAAAIEPINYHPDELPPGVLDNEGNYCWAKSSLAKRVAKKAMNAAVSRYFVVPPQEFTLLSRKLIGVFTLISAWDARFDGRDILRPFIEKY